MLDHLQTIQNELRRHSRQYRDHTDSFWRYVVAAEAIRVAWYCLSDRTNVRDIEQKVGLLLLRWESLHDLLRKDGTQRDRPIDRPVPPRDRLTRERGSRLESSPHHR